MFFHDDKKKIATLIRSKRSPSGEKMLEGAPMKSEIVKTADGDIDGRHVAMQDFMSAHQEGSAAKMAEALANFVDIHAGMHKDAESPDGE